MALKMDFSKKQVVAFLLGNTIFFHVLLVIYTYPYLCSKFGVMRNILNYLGFFCFLTVCEVHYIHFFFYFFFVWETKELVGKKTDQDSVNGDSEYIIWTCLWKSIYWNEFV